MTTKIPKSERTPEYNKRYNRRLDKSKTQMVIDKFKSKKAPKADDTTELFKTAVDDLVWQESCPFEENRKHRFSKQIITSITFVGSRKQFKLDVRSDRD